MRTCYVLTRRGLVERGALLGAGAALLGSRRALAQTAAPEPKGRVSAPLGAAVGDLDGDRAIVWSKADREARLLVELSTTEGFKNGWTVQGPAALEDTDFTAKLDVPGLPAGQRIFYRVRFLDLGDLTTLSEPVAGTFVTPPSVRRDVRFVWTGDCAGQGWGINPEWGGYRIFEAMRQVRPDFFVHSGDTIYADNPIKAEVDLPDGTKWKNVTTEAKSKVAETLAEFRGAQAYNLLDENLRRFNAEVASFPQWDDHEVLNNWYWEKLLTGDDRYKEKRVSILASRAQRAFLDYQPVRPDPFERARIYRSFRWGPLLELFRLDERSYRGPNGPNMQETQSHATEFLGPTQIHWLKERLLASDATWKVIASDMPLSIIVYDDGAKKTGSEAFAQGDDGPPRGRELEIADLLGFIHRNRIRNVVWLTADVHYTAAHRYDPGKAGFQDFTPFWEFVSGPLNAGTFGPNELDGTFGPEVVFQKAPEGGKQNLPPSAGYQFFGQVDIDGESEAMTVTLKDLTGASLFAQTLTPEV
jgi:alkaline phosphatase D